MIHGYALATDNKVIVGFYGYDEPTKEKLVKDNGGKLKKTFNLISAVSADISDENITKLKKDPRVKYIVNDTVYTMTDEYTSAWGVQHINSREVHNQSIYGEGVKIAVLDTGIIGTHEDLKDNYEGGYDFVNNDPDPLDDNCDTQAVTCHGTHVSGIIAARNNGIGVVGVAPNASIYAVKVLHASGSGDTSWIIAGLQWAVDNNMTIATMSFGGADNIAMHEAVDNAYNAGILLVASAGNNYGGAVLYPAAYDSVIAVSATDGNDQPAGSSNIGPKIELAAPGVNIYSTVRGGYGILSGTSMAAPHVTGVAALIYSTNFSDVNGDGEKNNKDVRELLHKAKDLGTPGKDDIFGYGLVDASMSVPGISSPIPTINIILKRTNAQPEGDTQKINFTRGNYSIKITNVNLTEVEMRVYEKGILQRQLSRNFEFSSKRKEISFDLTVNNSTVAFTPKGKKGAVGYLTIKSY